METSGPSAAAGTRGGDLQSLSRHYDVLSLSPSSETRVFSEGRWTHSRICCRASDAASMGKRETWVFHVLGQSANVCAAGCRYFPCCCLEQEQKDLEVPKALSSSAEAGMTQRRCWDDTEQVLCLLDAMLLLSSLPDCGWSSNLPWCIQAGFYTLQQKRRSLKLSSICEEE